MLKTKLLVALAAVLFPLGQAAATERCPAGQSGCTVENAPQKIQERVNEGAQKVWNNSNPQGRVNEVKKTVQDCVNCGMDALQDGANRIQGTDNSSNNQ